MEEFIESPYRRGYILRRKLVRRAYSLALLAPQKGIRDLACNSAFARDL